MEFSFFFSGKVWNFPLNKIINGDYIRRRSIRHGPLCSQGSDTSEEFSTKISLFIENLRSTTELSQKKNKDDR